MTTGHSSKAVAAQRAVPPSKALGASAANARERRERDTLHVLIVDDEPWARDELKLLLAERRDVTVVGEADSVARAVAQLEQLQPDVTFLDLELRDENGFEVFERAAVLGHVVLVTAHEDYAVRAFEVNALDYLLKPVEPEHLDRALSRVGQRLPASPAPGKHPLDTSDRVTIRDANRVRSCSIGSIAYLHAASVYTEIHFTDGEVTMVREPLHSWEERLPATFIRIHRSTLINLSLFESLLFDGGHWHIQLRGIDQRLVVSRRLARTLKERLRLGE